MVGGLTEGVDMVKYRVVKRLPHTVIYDRLKSPWYSPWKYETTRWSISSEGFEALTQGKSIDGEKV